MAILNTTPVTGGTIDYKVHGNSKVFHIIERVSIDDDSGYAALTQKLPARCRVDWVQFKLRSAVVVADGVDTNGGTPDTFALVNSIATGASTVSTMAYAVASTTLDSGTEQNRVPAVTSNTTTSPVSLYLRPIDSGGSQYFNLNSTPTSGFYFNADATVDVVIKGEVFDAPA